MRTSVLIVVSLIISISTMGQHKYEGLYHSLDGYISLNLDGTYSYRTTLQPIGTIHIGKWNADGDSISLTPRSNHWITSITYCDTSLSQNAKIAITAITSKWTNFYYEDTGSRINNPLVIPIPPYRNDTSFNIVAVSHDDIAPKYINDTIPITIHKGEVTVLHRTDNESYIPMTLRNGVWDKTGILFEKTYFNRIRKY
jgi:hypothetical protein